MTPRGKILPKNGLVPGCYLPRGGEGPLGPSFRRAPERKGLLRGGGPDLKNPWGKGAACVPPAPPFPRPRGVKTRGGQKFSPKPPPFGARGPPPPSSKGWG